MDKQIQLVKPCPRAVTANLINDNVIGLFIIHCVI